MKNFASKFALIGLLTAVGLAAMWPPREKLKLGIDLSGGTILVYEADNLPRGISLDELIGALRKRINPEGVLDIPIRKIGNNRIEIILPQASPEEVEEVKNLLTEVGSLQFRILANAKHDRAAVERARGSSGLTDLPDRYDWAKVGEIVTGNAPTYDPKADPTRISDPAQFWKKNRYAGQTVELTGEDASGKARTVPAKVARNTINALVLADDPGLAKITAYRIEDNPSGILDSDESVVRERTVRPGLVERLILYKRPRDRQDVTGKDLARVYETQDQQLQPAVGFDFNHQGGRKFGALTREHMPEEDGFRYRLAILLDDRVMSAPSINDEIRDTGIITGVRTEEVGNLITILQSGSLPASLNPTPLQQEKIGPTLGEDTINKGIRAITISMLVVPLFMIAYYRFAGVVAVVALVLNMILLLGSMAFFQATFTLPGLAGLALTIGMAVDANVLIFERMREEKERGASMSQQIRNGFARAWTTILDSNVTTMLSGLVLYVVGTEEIKGFALTLIIGLIWNLFTAVYVSRVIFEFWNSRGWLKSLSMMKILDKTNIDFIGPRRILMAISAVVIALGLAAFYKRGTSMYNIDFTGGTLVTISLNDQAPEIKDLSQAQRVDYVRGKAGILPDVTVESLNVGGEQAGVRFNIRTTESDLETVQREVVRAFGESLTPMSFAEGEPAEAGDESTSSSIEARGHFASVARRAPSPFATALTLAQAEPEPKPTPPLEPKPSTASTPASKATDVGPAAAAKPKGGKFADGRTFTLRFNTPQPPSRIASAFVDVLRADGVDDPASHFAIEARALTPATAAALADSNVEPESKVLVLRTDLADEVARGRLQALQDSLAADTNLLFERVENFGATVAGETRNLALIAVVASWLVIIAYVWFRFRSISYGLAAVIALVHDVLVTLGAVAATFWLATVPGLREVLLLDQFKIDLPMTAAFLTLIGFSVNDTIVIFDRIREIKGKMPTLTPAIVNAAINQTLGRTILTSLTAWLVVMILYVFGGEGLHGFSFCLVVGFLSGTYSTIYIAAPILIDWAGHGPGTPADRESSLVTTR